MGLREQLDVLSHLRHQVERQLSAGQTFGERLRSLRRDSGQTLEQVASRSGISKAYLSQMENGRVDPPRDAKVRTLEEVFSLRPGELVELAHLARTPPDVRDRLRQLRVAFDRAEQTVQALMVHLPTEAAAGQGAATLAGNVTPPEAVVRRIPIINCVAAGYPAEFTDLDYPAGVADHYVGAPPDLDDPHAFAVRVVGDSMEPRYREGDIVVFAPEAHIRSGDDCYVRFAPESSHGQSALFKRVYFDNEAEARLQPLNERYPPTVVALSDIAGMYRAVFRYESL